MDKKVEVLITTMNNNDCDKLLKSMNISSSFIIGNQNSLISSNDKKIYNGYDGIIVNRISKGVGKNRNETLFASSGDFCVLADDDMVFKDDYKNIVVSCFNKYKKAEVIIFNLSGDDSYCAERKNKKSKKVNMFNYFNYGAARIAFKRDSIIYNGISFNTMFGGGTIHSCGEDSLFIRDCLKKNIKIIAIPDSIASINDSRESSWFKGYNEKYFYDKGVFLQIAHPKLSRLFSFYLVLRHKEYTNDGLSKKEIKNAIKKGINFVKRGYLDEEK